MTILERKDYLLWQRLHLRIAYWHPNNVQTTTKLADKTGLLSLFPQIEYTRSLIGETLYEIEYIHDVSFSRFFRY